MTYGIQPVRSYGLTVAYYKIPSTRVHCTGWRNGVDLQSNQNAARIVSKTKHKVFGRINDYGRSDTVLCVTWKEQECTDAELTVPSWI